MMVSLVQAQEAPKKNRGHIVSIDLEQKTLVLGKKSGETTGIVWDENTRLKSPVLKDITDLKPNMWVLCFMVDQSNVIATIRHSPDQDRPE